MNQTPNRKGLREQIAAAETIEEVNRLLEEGKTHYRFVSLKTARQWNTTANRRIAELEAVAEADKANVPFQTAPAKPALVFPVAPVSNGRAERRRARRAAARA